IVEEGDLAPGDEIEKVSEEPGGISVADVVALYRGLKTDAALLERALQAPLFGSWKQELRERRS
ncbi:MAG TPA: hypothetical protein VG273_11650, partial [Bryobacteraceae bacterium]|nr:hypothetical protein [Bryobacteraceae bacterium]